MRNEEISHFHDLKGKRALVVGGCGQLGRAISHGLAQLGVELVVSDLNQAHCEDVVRSLPSGSNCRHVSHAADLSEQENIEALAKGLLSQKMVDIVIHCIGVLSSSPLPGYAVPFSDQSLEAWNKALKVNLTSAFLLAKGLDPFFREGWKGSVVFLSSIYGFRGPIADLYEDTEMANPFAYGASKGGMLQLMRYLAAEWAPRVRVNCVSPGGVKRGQPQEFLKRYEKRTLMQRMAEPDDIVGPVLFLASNASKYITGHNLVVDGGWKGG